MSETTVILNPPVYKTKAVLTKPGEVEFQVMILANPDVTEPRSRTVWTDAHPDDTHVRYILKVLVEVPAYP